MFYVLAAGFLVFTVLMVSFFLFLGYLEWRDSKRTQLPPK